MIKLMPGGSGRGARRILAATGAVSFGVLFMSVALGPQPAAGALSKSPRPGPDASITSSGPLTSIDVGGTLGCQIRYVTDTNLEWFPSSSVPGDCGTMAALNGTLTEFPYWGAPIWTPVSQTGPTGAGTRADPYKIVTVVRDAAGVRLTQTDSYVTGNDYYSTSVVVDNLSGVRQTGNLYTAGDCYLGNSDSGYGLIAGTSPACSKTPGPGGRVEQLAPVTGGNNYFEGRHSEGVRTYPNSLRPYPDTCECNTNVDNDVGISWPVDLGPGATTTYAWETSFSPVGHEPLIIDATANYPVSQAGDENGYAVTLTNHNIDGAIVNTVTIKLPPGFRYRPGTTTGMTTANPSISGTSATGETLTWTGPFSLPANGAKSFDFKVTVSTVPGAYTIDAHATAPAGTHVVPLTAVAPIRVDGLARLVMSESVSPDTLIAGDPTSTSDFTLKVSNDGPSDAPGTVISDRLPDGISVVSLPPGCTESALIVSCDVGTVGAHDSATVVLTVRADAGAVPGMRTNTADTHSSLPSPDPSTERSTADFTVLEPPRPGADLSIAKSAPDGIAGTDVTWTIPVENLGPDSATSPAVTDTLPGDLTFVSASVPGGLCTHSGGTVHCTLPALAALQRADITLVTHTSPGLVPAGASSATVTNTATVSDNGAAGSPAASTTAGTRTRDPAPDPVPANNTAVSSTTIYPLAHLVPSKSAAPSPTVAGEHITYTLRVRNDGPSNATATTLSDALPPEVKFIAADSSPGCSRAEDTAATPYAENTVNCRDHTLAPGRQDTFKVTGLVVPTFGAVTVTTNSVYASSAREDPDPADARAVTTDVISRYDLAITKRPSEHHVHPGEHFSYLITVVNHGPSAAFDVGITDASHSRFLLGGLTATARRTHDCPVLGIDFRCTVRELLPGASVSIRMPVQASGNTPDGTVVTNTARVHSAYDINPGNNAATARVLVPLVSVPVTG